MGNGTEPDRADDPDEYYDEPISNYERAMELARDSDCGAAEVASALGTALPSGEQGHVWQHFDRRRGLGSFRNGGTPPDARDLLFPREQVGIRRLADGFGPPDGVHLETSEFRVLIDMNDQVASCRPGQVCVVSSVVCERRSDGGLRPVGIARFTTLAKMTDMPTGDVVFMDEVRRRAAARRGNGQIKTAAEADRLATLFGCRVRLLGPGMPPEDDCDFGWGRYYAVVSNRKDEVEGIVECHVDDEERTAVWVDGLMSVLASASSGD